MRAHFVLLGSVSQLKANWPRKPLSAATADCACITVTTASTVNCRPSIPRTSQRLLHRDAFRQVARLVDVGAFGDRRVIGEQLDRDRVEQRRDIRRAMRDRDAK